MTEIELGTREAVAEHFPGRLRDVCEIARYDMLQSDLIQEVTKGKYIGQALAPGWQSEDAIDMPRAWRFMIPVTTNPMALDRFEFGITVKDLTGMNHEESRFTHEMAIDEDLRLNLEKNEAVRQLFGFVGGDLVKRVNSTTDTFFAAIERRYRLVAEGGKSNYFAWSHLAYSRELLKTGMIVQRAIEIRRRKNNLPTPRWMYELTVPRNRYNAARYMALSALAQTLEH